MKYIAVVTTISDLAEAQSMARALVERKLAACVQISEIESFYSWNESNSAGQQSPLCINRLLCNTLDPIKALQLTYIDRLQEKLFTVRVASIVL